MIDHNTMGTMLLCLAANGETDSLSWSDLSQATYLRIEKKGDQVARTSSSALDRTSHRTKEHDRG